MSGANRYFFAYRHESSFYTAQSVRRTRSRPTGGVSTGARSALVRRIGGGPPTSNFFSFERQRKIEKWPREYHGALLATLSYFISSSPKRREKSRSIETSIPCKRLPDLYVFSRGNMVVVPKGFVKIAAVAITQYRGNFFNRQFCPFQKDYRPFHS